MKILILTITAGEGHNSTAAALKAGIDKFGVECKIEDVYKLLNRALYSTVAKGYLFATKHLKKLYGDFYRLAEMRSSDANSNSPMRSANSVLARMLYKYIKAYDPDAIVFTHIFAGVLLDEIKVKHGLRAKTIGIITDFRVHPYWEEALHLDYVVCADKRMSYNIYKKGFKPSQVLPLGIPVRPQFLEDIPKEDARKELGIDNKLTVLMMGGSMGFGKLVDNVKELDGLDVDFQMIAVCGNNAKAFSDLRKMRTKKKLYVYGYANNVDVMMSAADCIVTKPGGLTVSEALTKRLPMILVNPIPGQEDRNEEFLLNNGAAIATSKSLKLDEAVWMCMTDSDRLRLIREAIDQIRHPNAIEDICAFAVEQAKEAENK